MDWYSKVGRMFTTPDVAQIFILLLNYVFSFDESQGSFYVESF